MLCVLGRPASLGRQAGDIGGQCPARDLRLGPLAGGSHCGEFSRVRRSRVLLQQGGR